MKQYSWDEKKNEKLIQERGVSFEDIVQAIGEGHLLEVGPHTNGARYPNQKLYFVQLADYVYVVPNEEIDGKIRLITIIPSRKASRKYLSGNEDQNEI
jgi:uncharacterized DUF497 family protein